MEGDGRASHFYQHPNKGCVVFFTRTFADGGSTGMHSGPSDLDDTKVTTFIILHDEDESTFVLLDLKIGAHWCKSTSSATTCIFLFGC